MYNGIGLTTPRGSGTNGYVQRNLSFVRHHKEKVEYRTEEDLKKLDAAANKRPNEDILAHQRKRNIELKCMELRAAMEEQGYQPDEIESKVAAFRANLLAQDVKKGSEVAKDEFGRPLAKESHQMAEAAQEKNKKLKEALGISQYFVEGSSLDPDRKAKETTAKEEAKKKYELVPDPVSDPDTTAQNKNSLQGRPASPDSSKKKKTKKRKHARSESASPRSKKKRRKTKHRRSSSVSSSSSTDSEDSASSSESDSDSEHSYRSKKRSKKLHHSRASKRGESNKKGHKLSTVPHKAHKDRRKHSKKKHSKSTNSDDSSSSARKVHSPSDKTLAKGKHGGRGIASGPRSKRSSSSDGDEQHHKSIHSQKGDYASQSRRRSRSPYKKSSSPPRKYLSKEKDSSPVEARSSDSRDPSIRSSYKRSRDTHVDTAATGDDSRKRHSRDSRSLSYSPIPASRSQYANIIAGTSRSARKAHSSSPEASPESSHSKTGRESKIVGESLTHKHQLLEMSPLKKKQATADVPTKRPGKSNSSHRAASSTKNNSRSSSSASSRASSPQSCSSRSTKRSKSRSDSGSELDSFKKTQKSTRYPSPYKKQSPRSSSHSISPSPEGSKKARANSRSPSRSSRSSHSSLSSHSSTRSHSSPLKSCSASPRRKKKYRSSRSPSQTSRHSRSNSKSSHRSSDSESSRHSSRSNHRASLTSPRSRSYSSRSRSYARSPSIPRRRGSPSFLDKRRITRSPRRSPRRRYPSSTAHSQSRDRKDHRFTHKYSDTSSRSHHHYH